MAAKKSLSDDEVREQVDALLGAFGVVTEAEPVTFSDNRPTELKTGERADVAPSGSIDALWGDGEG